MHDFPILVFHLFTIFDNNKSRLGSIPRRDRLQVPESVPRVDAWNPL
jgi:hypothetical protein